MIVTIKTGFREVVKQLLFDNDLVTLDGKVRDAGKYEPVIVEYPDDLNYRSISSWASDALGCGLIYGFDVER